jgi:hypothetical protein
LYNDYLGNPIDLGMRNFSIEEHQLDYDWRFAEETGVRLADLANSAGSVLLIGCPSLAPILSGRGRRGQLIERNPNYVSNDKNFNVVYADLRFERPVLVGAGRFACAFVDPPWYPQELLHWTNFGLSQIENGGAVFFSLWPASVRPTALDEHRQILGAMSKVGRLEQLGTVSYQLPPFERRALQASAQSASERKGTLFRLTKDSHQFLEVPEFQKSVSEWLRFTLSGEQLAILVGSGDRQNAPDKLFEIEPFTLTDTSRRNVKLPSINIWTSKNRVARLFEPAKLANQILAQDEASLIMLVEAMNMGFDPLNVEWGKSWRHPA